MDKNQWDSMTPENRAEWMHNSNKYWGDEFILQCSSQTWETLQRYAKECIIISGLNLS